MDIFLGILLGLFCLIFLVTAHEFGHFLMAKKSGVRVLEFGICFPPRAVAWIHVPEKDKKGHPILKKNGKQSYKWVKLDKKDWNKPQEHLIFSINYLPIGGFCSMDGESDSDTRPHTFGASTFRQKTKILLGGVLANWLIAFLIFTILAWTGIPSMFADQIHIDSDATDIDTRFVSVVNIRENSPAARAGLEDYDIIRSASFDNTTTPLYESSDLIDFNSAHAGQTVTYDITRHTYASPEDTEPSSSAEITLSIDLDPADSEWGYILGAGIGSGGVRTSRYTWTAPIIGAGTTIQITGKTFSGIAQMLWNVISGAVKSLSPDSSVRDSGHAAISDASQSVSGPVGIIGDLFPSVAKSGLTDIAYLIGLISVSLACMNILPIPALDGGRLLMIFLARLKHQRLSKEREETLVAKTMIGLLIFMAVITILDIIRIANGG